MGKLLVNLFICTKYQLITSTREFHHFKMKIIFIFSGHWCEVNGANLCWFGEVWGVGLLWWVQQTGRSCTVGCFHADPDHSGCSEESQNCLWAAWQRGKGHLQWLGFPPVLVSGHCCLYSVTCVSSLFISEMTLRFLNYHSVYSALMYYLI